jgi:hypothetical protein
MAIADTAKGGPDRPTPACGAAVQHETKPDWQWRCAEDLGQHDELDAVSEVVIFDSLRSPGFSGMSTRRPPLWRDESTRLHRVYPI